MSKHCEPEEEEEGEEPGYTPYGTPFGTPAKSEPSTSQGNLDQDVVIKKLLFFQ